MSLESQIAALVQASNNLTSAVNGKIGEIDRRMDQSESSFEVWKRTTSFVQQYYVASAEKQDGSQNNTENYNLIKLYTIKNAYTNLNPWIHLGWTGNNVVGAGHFCSLAQSHAGYTGQVAIFSRRGNGEVRFFVDRTNQNNAPVYVALKNTAFKNAGISLSLSSYMSLEVQGMGAVNISNWLAGNVNLVEISLVEITNAA